MITVLLSYYGDLVEYEEYMRFPTIIYKFRSFKNRPPVSKILANLKTILYAKYLLIVQL